MHLETIYLDLDGVLANFLESAIKLHGISLAEYRKNYAGSYDTLELAIGKDNFWKKIHSQGAKWWAELETFDYSLSLWQYCQKIANTYVLTSPANSAECYAGKYEWCKKNLGCLPIICKDKYLLANSNALLVDDSSHKIDKFKSHGGQTILWPNVLLERNFDGLAYFKNKTPH